MPMMPIRRTRFFDESRVNRNNTDRSTSTQRITANARVLDHRSANLRASDLPEALPSPDSFAYHAKGTCPLANVVLTEHCELQPWLLVVHPVTKAYAEKVGGCIVFAPPTRASEKRKGSGAAAETRYYCIVRCDDKVYGRAAYLPRTKGEEKTLECVGDCCCPCCVAEKMEADKEGSGDCSSLEHSLRCCSGVRCGDDAFGKLCASTKSE